MYSKASILDLIEIRFNWLNTNYILENYSGEYLLSFANSAIYGKWFKDCFVKKAGGGGENVYARGPTGTKYENGVIIYFVEFYQINVI